MFRVVVITQKGEIKSNTCPTKDDAELWVLQLQEKEELKRADVMNQETKEREKLI